MFSFIKQVFIILFSQTLVRPNLSDLNHVELKYYPFMISLDKCSGSCSLLLPKTCFLKKTVDINAKAFNMIANENEA